MNKHLILLIIISIIVGCGGSSPDVKSENTKAEAPKKEEPKEDGKGIGEFTHVELNDPLDQAMIDRGEEIYELKCSACHKRTAQRVVGPGFLGITERRKPEWIMNMVTNVEVMLEEDEAARELLKQCLTRMPNQNLTNEDARAVLEWLYNNDAQAGG